MLHRVIGPAGSGKTEYLFGMLSEAYQQGEHCVWIAPEQQTFQIERDILTRLGNRSSMLVDVLTFHDLPDRIAKEYGDVAVSYLDKGASCALLSVLADRNRDSLQEYADAVSDPGFLANLLELFGRLRSEMISPKQLLEIAAHEIPQEKKALQKKMTDIARLYSAYDSSFSDDCRDSRNMLSVLAEELPQKPFFQGKIVFLDGFYTLHRQEMAVLKMIFRQAKEVWFGFSYDERELFADIRKNADEIAQLTSGHQDIYLQDYKRSASDELSFLEKNLWESATPSFAGKTGNVSIWKAKNAFDESHAVASEIMRLIRGGMRYRDISVLIRNPEDYKGILDAVLQSSGIPFFFSEKEDIVSRPLFSFVFSSLELVCSNFAFPAVRRYLKSGYSGIPVEECDAFLRYAESWSLRGKAFYDEHEWTKNPDGFVHGRINDEQASLLAEINRTRSQFAESTYAIRNDLKSGDTLLTVDEMLRVIYRHMEKCGVDELFVEKINQQLNRGEEEDARKDSQLWEMLVHIFESLHQICGSEEVSVSRMLSLLKVMAQQYNIGTIPSSTDSVTIGNPVSLCPDASKVVFIMGCNDGVFPASVGKSALFDEEETKQLNDLQIHVNELASSKLTKERYAFYRAVTAPTQRLILTYPIGTVSGEQLRPSFGIYRICALLPHLEVQLFEADAIHALYSADSASAFFPMLPEGEEKERIRKLLEERGLYAKQYQTAICDCDSEIDFVKSSISLSPSSIERYRYCPFSYYAEYILKLKEKEKYVFSNQEIGTFIHSILEQYLASHTKTGRFVPPSDDIELDNETNNLIEKYMEAEIGDIGDRSRQFQHTFRNLRKTIRFMLENLTEEFSRSDFVPVGFEVGIGSKDGLRAIEIPVENGKRAFLNGTIDRVDIYPRDGETFVRVVDYKTYEKDMSLTYLEQYGLDEQMPLYLYAYCKSAEGGRTILLPAGALYSNVQLPFAKDNGSTSDEEKQSERKAKLQKKGILLHDEDVLLAMDRTGSEDFIPVKHDSDGFIKKTKALLSAAEFDELQRNIEARLKRDAENIFAGKMDISPLNLGSYYEACHYCKFKGACRYCGNEDKGGDE